MKNKGEKKIYIYIYMYDYYYYREIAATESGVA